MTLIALFSDKGSPGVTSVALALASVWPRRVILAELDPAGADLALRLTDADGRPALKVEPGLLTLAAAARSAGSPNVWDHVQPLPYGTAHPAAVLLGLAAAEQGAGMASLWTAVADTIGGVADGDVLADLGRLQPGSPAHAVAERADVLVGVARADAEGMLRLRDRLTHLLAGLPDARIGHPRRAVAVLVGADRGAADAVTSMRTVLAHAGLAVQVAGCVPLDPAALADLHRGRLSGRTERSLLLRGTRTLLPALTAVPAPDPLQAMAFRAARRPSEAGAR
jgi:hypothetical protein